MGAFFAVVFAITAIFYNPFPLSAQTPAPGPALSGTAVDESSIIIGETQPAPVSGSSSSVGVLLRMVLVLALAALAIYGVVFFIKRMARPQEIRDPNLKVLARVPLGSDSFAAVVSVGAKAWLVGGGSGGVSLISEINDNESLETMLLEDARRSAETGSRFFDFRLFLSKLGRSGEKPGSRGDAGSHVESLRKQRERLRGR